MEKELTQCDECKSLFYTNTSKITSLCPECAHYLYGYENCTHFFYNGRCKICYWDQSTSSYISSLKS